jgi:biotin carboxyl carrier protein
LTGRYRVTPSAASVLPGDEAREIDLAALALAGEAARGMPPGATVGELRRSASGATLVEVVVDGWRFELEVEDDARATLRERATRARDATAASGPLEVRAAIPGRIAVVAVTAGDEVEAGATLLVVEAMKMQNELRAPRSGTVQRVAVGAGETIELGDLLAVIA